MQNKQPCTYLLASKKSGTLYTGVTSNLIARVYQHKNHMADGVAWQRMGDRVLAGIGRQSGCLSVKQSGMVMLKGGGVFEPGFGFDI